MICLFACTGPSGEVDAAALDDSGSVDGSTDAHAEDASPIRDDAHVDDAGTDAGMDASNDGEDASAPDPGTDAGLGATDDAGADADSNDAGTDASGSDASTNDAGSDASTSQPANVVFVTSITHDGNFGGLTGADQLCQTLADGAGLAGTYRAWLSTRTVNAPDRLAGARGWVRPDGRPVADTVADLVAGHLFFQPSMEESGTELGDVGVFTGTDSGMAVSPFLCSDWTRATSSSGLAVAGHARRSSPAWDSGAAFNCSASQHLYCFGVDHDVPVAPPSSTYRRVFTSAGQFAPSSGRAMADALCASEASAAGLSGTFLALLPTATTSAASRFDTTGAPWARVDDAPVAATAAAFFVAWDVAPSLSAAGAVSSVTTWNGAATPTTPAGSNACGGWTDGRATVSGISGMSDVADLAGGFGSGMSLCSTAASVICMER